MSWVVRAVLVLLLAASAACWGFALYSSLGHGWWPPAVVVVALLCCVVLFWAQWEGV